MRFVQHVEARGRFVPSGHDIWYRYGEIGTDPLAHHKCRTRVALDPKPLTRDQLRAGVLAALAALNEQATGSGANQSGTAETSAG